MNCFKIRFANKETLKVEADFFEIESGALVLYKIDDSVLYKKAIHAYAPGSWQTIKICEKTTKKTQSAGLQREDVTIGVQ